MRGYRVILSLVVLCGTMAAGASLAAEPTRTMVDLGTLPGCTSSVANDINEQGQIVGDSCYHEGLWHAFLWQNGVMQQVQLLSGARAINDHGDVAGFFFPDGSPPPYSWGATHAAVRRGSGGVTDLGSLNGESTIATDINNGSQVVGTTISEEPSHIQHAFLWDEGVMTDLGTLGGSAVALGINDRGDIVGECYWHAGPSRAFLWSNGTMAPLPLAPGATGSSAHAISEDGVIVGQMTFDWPPTGSQPVIWKPGSGEVEVLSSSAGTVLQDINSKHESVGYGLVESAFGSHAVLLDSTKTMLDLGTLGGDYSSANALNDRGDIVGSANLVNGGTTHAFLSVRNQPAAPPPPPPPGGGSGGGAGFADLKLSGSVSSPNAAVGETLEWRLQLTDTNDALAEGAFVDVQLPTGLSVVSTQVNRGPGCTQSGSSLRCSLDHLSGSPSAKVGNVTLMTRVTAPGELVLSATGGYRLTDPTPADNTVTLKANSPASATTARPSPPRTPAAGKAVTKTGSARGERLVGTRFADVLRGRGGNDTLLGLEGSDYLVGGAGRDTVRAGAGNDSIAARDRARDVISCGAGRDTVIADRIDSVSRDCETVKRT